MFYSSVDFLNIKIDNLSFNQFLYSLKRGVVFTTNVDHLIKLQNDEEFYETYSQADYVVCDSRILLWSSNIILGRPIKEQIAGSDFFPAFCEFHKSNKEIKVFLLGGTDESVLLAKENINRNTNSEIVIGQYSPPFGFELEEDITMDIIKRINQSKATVLAVGVGAPKQEKWIIKNKHLMPSIKIYLAVGATIEFESGNLLRAPKWMTITGTEWLYRLLKEPTRLWKRYLLDGPPIFLLTLKQRLGFYSNPWSSDNK